MAGHGRSGIIQYDDRHFRLIIDRVDNTRDCGREEGRITDKSKSVRIRFCAEDALGDIDAGAHAEAGIDHIQRHGVAQCIAADISAEDGLLSLHGCFDRVEGSPVGTSGAEDRRPDRNLRGFRHGGCFRGVPSQETVQSGRDQVGRILSGICGVTGQLAFDHHVQMIFACDIGQFPFDHGIQFLKDQHFIQILQELHSQLFRERMGRRHFENSGRILLILQVIQGQGQTDAAGRDALSGSAAACKGAPLRNHGVPAVFREDSGQFHVPGLDLFMIGIGKAGENDPAGGILLKPFRAVMYILVLIFYFNGRIGVADPGRRPEEYRCAVFLRKFIGLLDHVVGFLNGTGIKAGQLAEIRIVPCILLCLRGNGTRIVSDQDDHAALNADIFQAHQRIGGNIEAYLLHGDQDSGARVGGAGRHFHSGFFIDGPFHICVLCPVFGDRFQGFGGRRSRIARRQVHTCRDGPAGNGRISHEELCMHVYFLSQLGPEPLILSGRSAFVLFFPYFHIRKQIPEKAYD